MNKKVANFNKAYDAYFSSIKNCVLLKHSILEIGGGAHPSFENRSNISYTIVDPDSKELNKSPKDVHKLNLTIEQMDSQQQYDLIISKMVLEHIPSPDEFHEKVFQLLKPNGKAIHFFACRHSIPSFVNRVLPEFMSDALLRLLQNRNTEDYPKYPAYYKRTNGGVTSQIKYFEGLGYEVDAYNSYVGHKYFQSIPILKQLEQLYTWVLVQLKMKSLATVALVILKKKK
jgi:SAM-dependent methyltransferase